MLSTLEHSKHQQHLAQLPKIPQVLSGIKTLYSPEAFYQALIQAIAGARRRIYLIALYLEQDQGGQRILEALYQAKQTGLTLEIAILVDWHRAQRGRIGVAFANNTNADWYCRMAQLHPEINVPIYGVPVNTREALGVLHLKGFIIDNDVIYSGASINNLYLYQEDKYRYDRYHIIRNETLAETLLNYIKHHLLTAPAVTRLDTASRPKSRVIKNDTRLFRQTLREANYCYRGEAGPNELSITPLVGLGKKSALNKTIHHLLCSAQESLTLCTPYFNLPALLVRDLIGLLRLGRQVEIIVGDKTASDFYIPLDQPFNIIGALPYLYEMNLRRFLNRLRCYLDTGQLVVRLWKDEENTYHLKGIWVDKEWQLLTGSNLNPRAWRLDLENALLLHDPAQKLRSQRECELNLIRAHTRSVRHCDEMPNIADYPVKVSKLMRRLRRIRIDSLINRIL
ncbi:CDP-diacylglycerol--serine O-phosphatidyltransferase [secondary endosymbiont of Ctenarytaina eucalypti]|uniref:Phosphatidylserine/phosphatidylglycerophosphate/ cardiolipin synthase n=1 Tax=secondary endosymbiont of Ctenarytaina eucalypti TaxID=1199245 RepID=J3YSN0_9ENTR|nr:CDP-diacylglycerol--serine O-phosphatidyltransferase [secondary endosymbiont of Ctenarytaina eucalypti]AFP85303.1 phosphatidylserine/phosphatidylglycerophosphate/cardiolipin synthase [secondary endosymbiont of Ctenarytaina eucalypti]